MRRSLLIVTFTLAGLAAAHAEGGGWSDRGAEVTHKIVAKVQESWGQLKVWVAEKQATLTGSSAPGGATATPRSVATGAPASPAAPSAPANVPVDANASTTTVTPAAANTATNSPVNTAVVPTNSAASPAAPAATAPTSTAATSTAAPTTPIAKTPNTATPTAPIANTANTATPTAVAKSPAVVPTQVPVAPRTSNLQQIKAAAQNQKAFNVVDAGRKAQGPNLKQDKVGVAHADFMMAAAKGKTIPVPKAIPRLDIGREPKLAAGQFALDKVQITQLKPPKAEKLNSPVVISAQTTHQAMQKVVGLKGVAKAGGAKKLAETEKLQNRILSLTKVQGMKFSTNSLKEITEKPYHPLTPNDIRILAAMVLVERGDQCHVAAGLLYQLRNDKEHEAQGNYFLAGCAQKMGLPTQYVTSLLKVIAVEDAEYLPKLLEEMNLDIPYDSESKVGLALHKIQNKKLIPASAKAKVDYLAAKANLRAGNYAAAVTAAQAIPTAFVKYPEAQYILATAQYGMGQAKAAIETQEKLLSYLEKAGKFNELMVLTQLNLGRVAFQDKQFNKAKEYFLKIDKNHPLWIEALMEQGWAQLQSGDTGGAIGNMYSVHSPFFRNVFVPESYVIRTIGYLSLCQYGDAYKSLSMFEHNYRPWAAMMDKYANQRKNGSSGIAYYDTVRKYLKSPSSAEIDGLPHQVIREMGRQRDFLNHQQAINVAEDEMAQYKFLDGILAKDKQVVLQKLAQLKPRLVELQKHLTDSKANHEPKDVQNRWASLLNKAKDDESFLHFRLDIQMDSRKSFAEMTEQNVLKIAQNKASLRANADRILGQHFIRLYKGLNQMLENNELLRYEVFAGSGENLRFQAAGGASASSPGAAGKRVPASAKPTAKNLQWEFDGEFWADEIGNYRSTLSNNCPEGRNGKVAGGE